MIQEAGGTALVIAADVTDPSSVKQMAEQARSTLGPIEVLINNAGDGGPFGPTWDADPETWWRCIETNLRGPFLQ